MGLSIIRSDTRSRQLGYTLLELLLVLGLLGLFASWTFQMRPSNVGQAIVALRSQIVQARFEAIERNSPVAVVYRSEDLVFLTLAVGHLDIGEGCLAGEELGRLRLEEFRRVRVKNDPLSGLVWLPSGTGRTCSGSGAFNQTIALVDHKREARVIVSRAGRVRSEVQR
ncbi:MAG: GspH/FimT family pseudopilin [Trueperaceae bacterium]